MQVEKKFKQAASFINTFNKFIDKNDKVNINENDFNNLTEFIKSFQENYFIKPEDINTYPILGIINNENGNGFDEYDVLFNYKYRYVDSEYNYINNFDEFSYRELTAFNEHNIAPYLAEKIAVIFKNSIIGFIELENFKRSFGERKYRVGLMSDVHYNDYTIDMENSTYDEDGSEYRNDILNALSFYQNKEDVDFMCVAGDLSTDSIKHILNFKQTLNNYAPTTNLYSCFGNHDFCATADIAKLDESYNEIGLNVEDKDRLEAWNSLITPENSEYEIHYQDETNEYGKTSYWFEVPIKGTNKSDIYVFLSVNYTSENRKNIIDELTWEKINTSDIIIDSSKNNYDDEQEILESSEEFNVVLKYSNVGQRFGFNFGNINNCSKYVKINNYKIIDADDNDITDLIDINNPKIGIYGTDETYHIDGMIFGKTFNFNDTDLIEMPISSSFSSIYNISFPITLYMDIEAGIGDEDYQIDELNRSTIANLKLTEESPNIQPLIDYVGYMPSRYNLKFYDNAALIWLKDVLEQFANKRIFIFTHQFFSHKAGSNNIENGFYSYAGDYWRITDDSAYCLSGIQFEFLNKLNNEHKNTIWFTGHSHYKWGWQIEDPYINICNNEYEIFRPDDEDFDEMRRYLRRSQEPIGKSGYNIHLPSTCRPLPLGITDYGVAGEDSEGAIMDIYEDYVDIRGIVFKESGSEYKNKYCPISQYRINIPAA